jgi:hypothetical protein
MTLSPRCICAGALLAATLTMFAPATASAATACANPTDVVVRDVAALNSNDADALLNLFREDAQVFAIPTDPTRLSGALSSTIGTHVQRAEAFPRFSALGVSERTEILGLIGVGDLVFAKLKFTSLTDPARVAFMLTAFRIQDCQIADLWHIARTSADDATTHAAQASVVSELADANNAGDIDRFLSLFAPDVLHFRDSGVPHTLADRPARFNGDAAAREAAFRTMFANGAPVQVVSASSLSVGDLYVNYDVAAFPDGRVIDEISVYRIVDGRITHDWFVIVNTREVGSAP